MSPLNFIPGPSKIYPTIHNHVKKAFSDDLLRLGGVPFKEIYRDTQRALREVLDIPDSHRIFFVSSGTEAMQNVILNCVDECSFHCVNGTLSERFMMFAEYLGKVTLYHDYGFANAVTTVVDTVPEKAELICLTQCESSTGALTVSEEIKKLKKNFPEMLLAVDAVSSVPYASLDFSLVDCAFFSVQKCFCLPAGLGVMLVNESCIEKANSLKSKGKVIGSHHGFPMMEMYDQMDVTLETPNCLGIYLLGKVCQDYLNVGIEQMRTDLENRAEKLCSFIEETSGIDLLIKEKPWRLPTIIAFKVEGGAKRVHKKLLSRDIHLGLGLEEHEDRILRIANFFSHTDQDVDRLIKTLKEIL